MQREDEKPEEEDEESEIPLDKEIVFVVKLHETLVGNFEVSPISINLRKDPDIGFIESEFVLKYDLGFGELLIISLKREGGSMLIELESGEKKMSYPVPLDMFVDDEFMPVADEEFINLVQDWFE